MEDSAIIITNNSNKKNILRYLSKNKLLYNIKFYSFNELKKHLFFDYDNKTLEYIMNKYQVSLKIAKIYINNLYFLKDIALEKVKFLNSLKQDLEDKNLLIKNTLFKNYISNKKIIVYGFKKLTKEQELILSEINSNIEFRASKYKESIPLVYEAKRIQEEVEFVAIKVSELINKGIKIENIKLILSEDYTNIVKRYFSIFNIPINLKSKDSLYNTIISQDFLASYDTLDISENIDNLKEKYSDINDLVMVINKSVQVTDKKLRKEFIIEDLKNTNLKESIYDKAVTVSHYEDNFNDDDYVFWLGFNLNIYPKITKDDAFLNDNTKELLGLDTSIDINEITKENIKSKIQEIKNLIITYKLSNSNGTFYPSIIIEELALNIYPINIDPNLSYSKLNTKLNYAKSLDNLYKYNIWNKDLSTYQNSIHIPYQSFDHKFTGVNIKSLHEFWEGSLTLAYTNLEMYNECAFKYYLSKILKLDIFEENFKTIIGTVSHHILELALKKEINIPEEIIKFIKEKDYELNEKEYFYLEKIGEELKEVVKELKEQEKYSKLTDYLFESELYVYKDRDDMKITFKGLIDKVMYKEIDGKKALAVVDYKSGNTLITLDNLKWGLNLQLPIYLYLLKKSDTFKDALIVGFYIQKILDKVPNREFNKTLSDFRKENLKLQGFSNKDLNLLELLDNNYQDSQIIKGLRLKNNGEFYSTVKALNSKEMEDLTSQIDEKIEEALAKILNGEFNISPKVIKGKNISCTYCQFKDICYKEKEDEVILGGEEDELYR